jgi:predicted amidohydrolase YtcJ
VAVGGPDIARKYRAARTLDLKGRVLLPGFMDTHVHIIPRANAIWT